MDALIEGQTNGRWSSVHPVRSEGEEQLARCLAICKPTEEDGTEGQRLSGDQAMRLDDIALGLDISRQRANQLLNGALKKCAKWIEEHGFRLEDLLPDPRPDSDREDYRA